jgi:hypothetical protein
MTDTLIGIIAVLISFILALTLSEELYKFWHKAVIQLMTFSIKKLKEYSKS